MDRIGIVLALIVALCWGSADIVATIAARRQGTFITTLFSLLASSFILLLFGWFASPPLPAGNNPLSIISGLAPGLLVGLFAALGYFALYRGLELGPMAIVSPITAADGVVGALLAVLFLHNSLSVWQIGMMLLVFGGIVCASFDPGEMRQIIKAGGIAHLFKGGIWWGLLAMLAFGTMLFCIGFFSAVWGWYLPILYIRTIAALTLAIFALWRLFRLRHTTKLVSAPSAKHPRPAFGSMGLAIVVGLLETIGLLIYSLDTQLASTSLASVLSSSWGIIPLVAGIVFFRERPLKQQTFGIALVFGGLLLLAIKPV
ncbi:MAG TPA: DMT family transporter [Ktedonobacteraceae bacterium]|nr:DMT family transporter [Ktedonobacteraceae bacterium]